MRLFGHRTLAEVNETEALWALAERGLLPNNPPEVDELPWSAA